MSFPKYLYQVTWKCRYLRQGKIILICTSANVSFIRSSAPVAFQGFHLGQIRQDLGV